MSSMTFGQNVFNPKPPIKGSFPLDHEGECKKEMLEYLLCMSKNKSDNTKCRLNAKDYLECRMNKNLMDKQDLTLFGYNDDTKDDKTTKTNSSNKN